MKERPFSGPSRARQESPAVAARREGVYVMDDEERAAVEEGLDQARRSEFVLDDEMDAFWRKIGVL